MGEAAAFVKTMDATGPWTPIPILLAGCHPHGPVDGELMDHFLETIRAGLAQAGALDAVYIANHGAMLATNDEDPDGSVFALVRELVGPHTRIVVTLDLHGNISERMVSNCDLIIGYRTNPHVDMTERGEEAALAKERVLLMNASRIRPSPTSTADRKRHKGARTSGRPSQPFRTAPSLIRQDVDCFWSRTTATCADTSVGSCEAKAGRSPRCRTPRAR
jgi:microcystin degradation protein MlrC